LIFRELTRGGECFRSHGLDPDRTAPDVDVDELATVAAVHLGVILEYLGDGGARG
jgi:hypothetical protein